MSDPKDEPDKQGDKQKSYEVGYGKPPKASQFKPGRSGNVRGRRRSKKGAVDIDDVLDRPVEVTRDGQPVTIEPRKVALIEQIKKAKGGSLPALIHVLDQFIEHGVLGTNRKRELSGVLRLPSTMPFTMARILASRFGEPPWTKSQIAKGRDQYLKARSEAQAREDQAIGYEEL